MIQSDMNSERLKLLIAEGEGLTVEFKEKYTSKIDRDIVAMANSRGGFTSDTFFHAVFYRNPEYSLKLPGEKKVGEKVGEKISLNQRRILELIKSGPFISANELAGKIGISSRKTEENISKLKAKGLLKRVGSDKGGHWEVVE